MVFFVDGVIVVVSVALVVAFAELFVVLDGLAVLKVVAFDVGVVNVASVAIIGNDAFVAVELVIVIFVPSGDVVVVD